MAPKRRVLTLYRAGGADAVAAVSLTLGLRRVAHQPADRGGAVKVRTAPAVILISTEI